MIGSLTVWLVTVAEQLPIDSDDSRLLRTGTLAGYLSRAGHRVTWWTSTFNHVLKKHRFDRDKTIDIDHDFRIRLIHASGYTRHVSFRRLYDHAILAAKFLQMAPTEDRPDILVVSLPTLELAAAAVSFAWRNGIPVVLDIRDLWPDIFLDVVPRPLRPLAAPMLIPLRRLAECSCLRATTIIGPAQHYTEWGLAMAGRDRTVWDQEFPFAYSSAPPSSEAITAARQCWEEQGLHEGNGDFIACFFGTLGRQFDLETVIHAARLTADSHPRIRFVICGTGDREAVYRRAATGLKNILFPGWVGRAAIWTLMRMSEVGLAPYCSSPHFAHHLPNKPIEYLSANLPIATSLKGELGTLLEIHDCGVTYQHGKPEDLARQIMFLHDNRDRLHTMSRNAGELFQHHFQAERVYPEMITYLENLVRSRSYHAVAK